MESELFGNRRSFSIEESKVEAYYAEAAAAFISNEAFSHLAALTKYDLTLPLLRWQEAGCSNNK